MLCDKYKKALIEAAGGAALPSAVSEHVNMCAHCAAALSSERDLFAAIDAGLHQAANAKMRSSFLTNVKASLATETVPTRNPIPAWGLVCATGALALAVGFLSLPRSAHDKDRAGTFAVPRKAPPEAGEAVLSFAPGKTHYSAKALKARAQQAVSSVTGDKPEVLVEPEEAELLKRFYSGMRNPVGEAKVVVTDNHEVTPKSLVIEEIEVRDLRIENLDEESGLAQTETK